MLNERFSEFLSHYYSVCAAYCINFSLKLSYENRTGSSDINQNICNIVYIIEHECNL